ncbi:hypothetical protein EAY39_08225 [Vibrio anguillarum]|uniref:hypothetical protein n=2 Tax=Vibrio anguillarum TaxID=55601 RepID=UPI0018C326F0|nr:hypothetical protein [Vibrio anguillarum]MBF4340775.1 hypothetical protein [Vibrio anguillarum]
MDKITHYFSARESTTAFYHPLYGCGYMKDGVRAPLGFGLEPLIVFGYVIADVPLAMNRSWFRAKNNIAHIDITSELTRLWVKSADSVGDDNFDGLPDEIVIDARLKGALPNDLLKWFDTLNIEHAFSDEPGHTRKFASNIRKLNDCFCLKRVSHDQLFHFQNEPFGLTVDRLNIIERFSGIYYTPQMERVPLSHFFKDRKPKRPPRKPFELPVGTPAKLIIPPIKRKPTLHGLKPYWSSAVPSSGLDDDYRTGCFYFDLIDDAPLRENTLAIQKVSAQYVEEEPDLTEIRNEQETTLSIAQVERLKLRAKNAEQKVFGVCSFLNELLDEMDEQKTTTLPEVKLRIESLLRTLT